MVVTPLSPCPAIWHCQHNAIGRVSAADRGGIIPDRKDRFMKLSFFVRPASAGACLSVLALVAALAVSAVSVRAEDDPVVARVNGADVRQSDLTMAEEDLGSNIPQMTPEAKREYLITF